MFALLVCLEIEVGTSNCSFLSNALLQQTFTHVIIMTFKVYCEIKVVQIQVLIAY